MEGSSPVLTAHLFTSARLKIIPAFLRLIRPANIITSIADVLAGLAIAGYLQVAPIQTAYLIPVMYLVLSSACLYAGGIVFNDICDFKTDQAERPERVLPRGELSMRFALSAGIILMFSGILFAFLINLYAGIIAFLIALSALFYDRFGKHLTLSGPLNMGICRGLNLMLGISIMPAALSHWAILPLIPVCYIYAITMISRGEVFGGRRITLYIAAGLYLVVIAGIFSASLLIGYHMLPSILLMGLTYMTGRPLLAAISKPTGINIGLAVKAGILALIIMDAAWAAAFGQAALALVIILLLPVSVFLSKRFAVT